MQVCDPYPAKCGVFFSLIFTLQIVFDVAIIVAVGKN
jgi:hypothetical protein